MNDSIPASCTCPSGDGSLSHPCPAHSTDCASGAINLIDTMLDNPAIPMKSKARLRTVRGNVVALLQQANRDRSFDFLAHLERQQRFSAHTFGPGTRAAGIVDHIRKELLEIEADPGDLREWIDVTILALDGAWRSGATPQQVIAAIVEKQTKNESRVWPHWSTMPADKAIEHDRSGENHIGDANKMVGAAQEAVAWQRRCARPAPDGSRYEWHEISREQYLEASKGKWVSSYELRELYAAPVAAAPVDGPTEVEWMMACNEIGGADVAEEIITRAYSIAEMPRSTHAAPGIALPAMPQTSGRAPDDTLPGYFESDREWVDRNLSALRWFIENHPAIRQRIDASPKGGSGPFEALNEDDAERERYEVDKLAPENLLSDQVLEQHDAMQATSAEVGA